MGASLDEKDEKEKKIQLALKTLKRKGRKEKKENTKLFLSVTNLHEKRQPQKFQCSIYNMSISNTERIKLTKRDLKKHTQKEKNSQRETYFLSFTFPLALSETFFESLSKKDRFGSYALILMKKNMGEKIYIASLFAKGIFLFNIYESTTTKR